MSYDLRPEECPTRYECRQAGELARLRRLLSAEQEATMRAIARAEDAERKVERLTLERDKWAARESETQEALQLIGERFGFLGGEPRTSAVERVLTDLKARAEAAERKVEKLRERINARLNERLCEMKPDYDDSITGFNEAWDIVLAALAETEAKE